MVDPDRKINHLTDDDVEFLEECKDDYAIRFSMEDTIFAYYFNKKVTSPPIQDWGHSDSGTENHGGGGRRNRYGPYNRNRRGQGHWNHNRNYSNHRTVNDSRYSRGTQNGNVDTNQYRGQDYLRDNRDYRPIEIKRDYSNFVPATKEE